MFGSWNSAVQAIEDLIQVAGNHRAMMILNKVYKAFFHCEDFIHWAYKPNLPATFQLALEIEFKRELHLQNEGNDTDANYDLPQPLKKTAYIYVVTAVVETSFDPIGYHGFGYHGSTKPAFTSTLTGRPAEPTLHQMVHRGLSHDDLPSPVVDSNDDEEEEDFPTAPCDDWVWSVEPIPERDLCIHMAQRKPETSFLPKYHPTTGTCIQVINHRRTLESIKTLPDTIYHNADTLSTFYSLLNSSFQYNFISLNRH